jgi:hypothetical protein
MTPFDMFAELLERRLMRGPRWAVVFRRTAWGGMV